MPPDADSIQLTLQIQPGADYDAEELDRSTRQLLTEIRELDVESVELVKGEQLPAGAKAADPVTLGALALVVLPAVVPKLVEFLQSWSLRGENRTVKIKALVGEQSIEVEYSPTAMSAAELKRTVNALVESLPQTKAAKRK